jgi:hypothetical protein
MSDDYDNTNLTPLSSNSSGSSGTRAWSVSVVDETANLQPDETASTAPDQSESFSAPKAAPMTDNESRETVTEEVDLPVTENDLPASNEAEPIAADTEQTSEDEDVITSEDSSEALPQIEVAAPVSDIDTGTGEAETFVEAMAASDEPDTGFSEPAREPAAEEQTTEELHQAVSDNDLPASEEAEPIAADAEQTSEDEDVITSKDSSEALPQTEAAAPVSDTDIGTGETEAFAEAMAASDEPDTDTGFSEPAPEPAAEEQTTEELRQAVLDTMTEHEESQKETFALFERISEDFSAMMATARNDAAVFSIKLMEFAQANAQNSFELARAYSNARSVPEIFNVQADYLQRQMELLNTQARELQALTAKVTARNTMEIQNRHNSAA